MIEITDAMRRAVPAPCYQCDECMDGYSDCTCYPADMIGYVAAKNLWICSICIGENAYEILELVKWGDDDEPVYKHKWGGWPADKPPTPLYVCSWEDCGADSTWDAADLRWECDADRRGFFCSDHASRVHRLMGSRDYRPSLAEVLAVVNAVRCIDCGVVIEGVKSADREGVCDTCWQKFGKEVRDWINDKEGRNEQEQHSRA